MGWAFPSAAIAIHAIWVRTNAPPTKGEERVNSWDPDLEAVPMGLVKQPCIVNPRTTPWPDMVDPWPWTAEWATDAPPYLQSRKPTPMEAAIAAAEANCLPAADAAW